MKAIPNKLFVLCFGSFVIMVNHLWAGPGDREISLDSVILLNETESLYQSGDYYFSGQPSVETLQFLKEQGVSLVINLRSENEMKDFAASGFNEDSLVKVLGMKYLSIPMGGLPAYSPETLDSFNILLEKNQGKALIHCYGCYRATYLMMAWLIGHKKYPVDRVVDFGRRMKYFSPLEGLLNKKLMLSIQQ
jgi:protein tyrosine phosphatase (PTP) superfamily phosphohydrolase (DUF442 family)